MHTQLYLMERINMYLCVAAAYRFKHQLRDLRICFSRPKMVLILRKREREVEVMYCDRKDWFVVMENDIKYKHSLIKKQKKNESKRSVFRRRQDDVSSLFSFQGDFRHKSSFVIWGGRGGRGALCWVRDMTCGTELHAVWHGATAHAPSAQHDKTQLLKVCQRWHGESTGQQTSNRHTRRDWGSFVDFYHQQRNSFVLNYGDVSSSQLLHGF